MAGASVPIIRRTDYTFPATQTVIAGPQLVDTLGWVSGLLVVRVYGTPSISNVLQINVQNVMVAPEDELTVLEARTTGGALVYAASVSITTAGGLFTASLASPIGRFVRVLLSPTGAVTAVTLGIDLVGRSA
ncbi:MAG: hypothetical protein IPJ34_05595 [Myxococcales bacterium]|nr:hypothetical protein [Myxococcales bacterium]